MWVIFRQNCRYSTHFFFLLYTCECSKVKFSSTTNVNALKMIIFGRPKWKSPPTPLSILPYFHRTHKIKKNKKKSLKSHIFYLPFYIPPLSYLTKTTISLIHTFFFFFFTIPYICTFLKIIIEFEFMIFIS